MNRNKLTVIALLTVLIASFTVLLSVGSDIYREKPPILNTYVNNEGQTLFSQNDVEQGQLVWRSMGGHQLGSIWGAGLDSRLVTPRSTGLVKYHGITAVSNAF